MHRDLVTQLGPAAEGGRGADDRLDQTAIAQEVHLLLLKADSCSTSVLTAATAKKARTVPRQKRPKNLCCKRWGSPRILWNQDPADLVSY